MPNEHAVKPILLLSGPVGAGKSIVARELVATAPEPTVCIEGDTFWSFLPASAQPQLVRENFKRENFHTIMRSMTAAAVPYALAGYDVILDFSLPPWFLETARRIANSRDVPLDYVVIRPSEGVCAARAAARSQGTIMDCMPYSDLYASFDDAEHMIRDDVGNAASVAARIREGLNAGVYRLRMILRVFSAMRGVAGNRGANAINPRGN